MLLGYRAKCGNQTENAPTEDLANLQREACMALIIGNGPRGMG